MKKEEKDKMMEEIFSKKRSFGNLYSESENILKQADDELNRILLENQKEIEEMTKNFGYSDEDLEKLKKDIEKDFNVKVEESPKVIVDSKTSKEVFDNIYNDLINEVIGQDEACNDLVRAFRRPYVVGSNPSKIRNSIIISGSNGTNRHLLVNKMAELLKKYGLTTNDEVISLDMSRYQSSSQEMLFLQDLYVALTLKNPIIIIENFEESSSIFNRMLADLSLTGTSLLNKRYTFKNGQMVEASNSLANDIIDHLDGNNKTLIYITKLSNSKIMDIFGKSFVDNIPDKVKTNLFKKEDIDKIIDSLLNNLKNKTLNQLEITMEIDESVNEYLFNSYEPGDGIDSLIPIIDKIYDELVNIVLKNDEIKEIKLIFDEQMKIRYSENELSLNIEEDLGNERAEIQKELDDVVGLDDIKEYLLSLENLIKVNQIRKKRGLKTTEISKHMIFTGNPGTGKTTIARLVSRMMKACGILKQGQLVEVTRADLVGKYVGHTAPLTMDVINSAIGGVLFIDEAYSLYRGKDDSFGLEAIDTLVKAMEDHRDDLIVILAGYTKEMKEFLEANSGLKSRFANIIEFKDYTGEELMLIAKSIAKSKDYVIDEEVLEPLKNYFTLIQAKKDQNSGNGRLARNLVEEAILNQSRRLMKSEIIEEMNILKRIDFNLENV